VILYDSFLVLRMTYVSPYIAMFILNSFAMYVTSMRL
jgi:hypothetical protein